MVNRLAPVQAPPRVTVRQKDGSPTWSHDGEIAARRDGMVTGDLLRRLLHTKLEMRSGQLHSCQMEKLVRAFGAEVLQMRRLLSFLNHRVAQLHWQGLGKGISSITCVSSCKSCRPMPVWLARRKEHARCSSHPEKRVRKIHQLESPSKSPQLSARRFLV